MIQWAVCGEQWAVDRLRKLHTAAVPQTSGSLTLSHTGLQPGVSPRRGRKHKDFHPSRDARLGTPAWGVSPRNRIRNVMSPRSGRQAKSAARSAGSDLFGDTFPGLAPRALCFRALRALFLKE